MTVYTERKTIFWWLHYITFYFFGLFVLIPVLKKKIPFLSSHLQNMQLRELCPPTHSTFQISAFPSRVGWTLSKPVWRKHGWNLYSRRVKNSHRCKHCHLCSATSFCCNFEENLPLDVSVLYRRAQHRNPELLPFILKELSCFKIKKIIQVIQKPMLLYLTSMALD